MKRIEFADFVASMAYISNFEKYLVVDLYTPAAQDLEDEYKRINVSAYTIAKYHDYHVISIDAQDDVLEVILEKPRTADE